MGSVFHQLCPRYSGTLILTATMTIRLWETFTYTLSLYRLEAPKRNLGTYEPEASVAST